MVAITLITSFSNGANPTKREDKKPVNAFSGAKGEVKLITLDPGHFHAALVQKNMYDQVSPEVYVYALKGSDLDEHLKKIEGYNTRTENPTAWKEKVYTGNDYLEKMLTEKKGNVVVLAGNNRIKTDYIMKSVKAGFNVLADKPMVTSPEKFAELEEAFKVARKNGVLLYDIMTERHEISTILQKELSHIPSLFGKLQTGSAEHPAVEKVSVHFFYKNVSGNPLVRPAWFFDVNQQGEGIIDVTTHLVDLVQWCCFPNKIIQKSDIEMLSAKRWPTIISRDEFQEVTKLNEFPDYLKKDIKDGKLLAYSNGEMVYKLKGVYVKVVAEWKYKAPEGTGDTYFSTLCGSLCKLEIRQGKEENYIPMLYVTANKETNIASFTKNLEQAIASENKLHPDLTLEKINETTWRVDIPNKYRVGHEAHFGQVTEQFLSYLKAGKLPEWEVPNMIAKYYTTTSALKLAKKNK
ncbi:MAG: Gfo/Idh/MocA family oxidoreductase [Bacteroidetes bacterium]|nr:Gfo/Idh/MocA family oxidoreductase [Bacteroidota bacterium]